MAPESAPVTVPAARVRPPTAPDAPPSDAELAAKYHALADPVLGQARAGAIARAIAGLADAPFAPLADLVFQPISR